MGDQFEKFILDHRNDFDEKPDSGKVWKQIEKKLENKQKRDFSIFWKVAAVFLLISTGYLLFEREFFESEDTGLEQYSEFQKAEAFYTKLINEKREEINAYNMDGLKDEFIKDLEQLDQSYLKLKATFKREASDQKLVDAMIKNLQLRIDILNQQLSILKRLNETKNESDETLEI